MGRFAFLISPREAARSHNGGRLGGLFSGKLLETVLGIIPPVKVSAVAGFQSSRGEAGGWLVTVPVNPEKAHLLPGETVSKRIARAIFTARRLGAGVVGLGSFGRWADHTVQGLEKQLNITLSPGTAYPLAIAAEGSLKAIRLIGHSIKDARVVIIGATRASGRLCAHMLAGEVKRMTLVSGEKRNLEDLAARIYYNYGLSVNIAPGAVAALRDASLVIVAGGGQGWSPCPEDFPPGAVVWNLSRPGFLCKNAAHARKDVLFIEDGVVQVPGAGDKYLRPGFPPGTACPSMAEAMLLSMEGKNHVFQVSGNIGIKQVKAISALAVKHGFKLVGFRSGGRTIYPEETGAMQAGAAGP